MPACRVPEDAGWSQLPVWHRLLHANALTHLLVHRTDGNQEGVGAALARQSLRRDEYFVTSKIPGGLNASATTAALEQSLEELKLPYVDLMLLHWPASGAKSRQEQWLALETWAKQGKARAIGISHYCRHHLDDILAVATLPVALNQVQYHVGMVRRSLWIAHEHTCMCLHDQITR